LTELPKILFRALPLVVTVQHMDHTNFFIVIGDNCPIGTRLRIISRVCGINQVSLPVGLDRPGITYYDTTCGVLICDMSDPALLVLSSLAGGDKHGYAMMQDIEAFAGVRLGPGTLYGAITRLEQQAWIRPCGPFDRRQQYAITPAGRAWLVAQLESLQRIVRAGRARLKHA